MDMRKEMYLQPTAEVVVIAPLVGLMLGSPQTGILEDYGEGLDEWILL